MKNKGQEMSTSTIILLILGLVILVVLVLGFTMGWDKIAPWIDKPQFTITKEVCSPPINNTIFEEDFSISANDYLEVRTNAPILNFSNVRQKYSGDCDDIDLKSAIINADSFEDLKKEINSSLSLNVSKVYFSSRKTTLENDNGCDILLDFYYIQNPQYEEVCEQQEVENNIMYFCDGMNNCANINLNKDLKEPIKWLDFWCEDTTSCRMDSNGEIICDNPAQTYKCNSYIVEVKQW